MSRTIYTLTGNLLAERTFEYAAWEAGATQRARREYFQVGGKGINVAKMLARLGTPCTALAFVGGSSGADCTAWLRERTFDAVTFPSSTPTRSGLVVRSDHQAETTFLGPDVAPDANALIDCARFLDGLNAGDVLALCGSFPGWSSRETEPLRAALGAFAQRGSLVVDSYGPPLEWAIAQPLALLKINRVEFNSLIGFTPGAIFDDEVQRVRGALSVSPWIVTNGREDVWFSSPGDSAERFTPPQIEEVSATGSGDVFLASILHAKLIKAMSWQDAIRFALPLSAANARHPDVAEFSME